VVAAAERVRADEHGPQEHLRVVARRLTSRRAVEVPDRELGRGPAGRLRSTVSSAQSQLGTVGTTYVGTAPSQVFVLQLARSTREEW
jgi:hypothetical protein